MLQVDAKAGVAHVELLQGQGQGADQASTEKPKEGNEVDATAEVATTADAATAPPASSPTDSSTAEGAASRVFFLLKVRASTPTIRYVKWRSAAHSPCAQTGVLVPLVHLWGLHLLSFRRVDPDSTLMRIVGREGQGGQAVAGLRSLKSRWLCNGVPSGRHGHKVTQRFTYF